MIPSAIYSELLVVAAVMKPSRLRRLIAPSSPPSLGLPFLVLEIYAPISPRSKVYLKNLEIDAYTLGITAITTLRVLVQFNRNA